MRSEPQTASDSTLRSFCAKLSELRSQCGIPVTDLLPVLPRKRAQVYAILSGDIAVPPSWEFVRAFVEYCARNAVHRPSISTDLTYWRHEHNLTVEIVERGRQVGAASPSPARTQVLTVQRKHRHDVVSTRDGRVRQIGLITGDIRQVHGVDIWVNSENTDMVMARVQERSISAIIRYEGAERDAAGRVVIDRIADQLAARTAGLQPLSPGQVITTDAGELAGRNGVRFVIHAAAVLGAPGAGFQPIREPGRCVINALVEAEKLDPAQPPTSILFPLLACGEAHGDSEAIVPELIHSARNHLESAADLIETVWFLAYTERELEMCMQALESVNGTRLPAQRPPNS